MGLRSMQAHRGGTCGVPFQRRTFLKGAAGLVGVTIMGVPTRGRAEAPLSAPAGGRSTPGVATMRIDGRAKVTGQKIFARDFNARDMPGWQATQWYGFYLCALTTEHVFLGLDLSSLPDRVKPARIILGDQLSAAVRKPKLRRWRDTLVERRVQDLQAAAMQAPAGAGFDNLLSGEPDLIVPRGNVPDFLGQAVALLMFDSIARYRAAKRFMQFRDAEFQIYALDSAAAKGMNAPFPPTTTYVKYFQGGETFSYATAGADYKQPKIDEYKDKIATFLSGHKEFLTQEFDVSRIAMDPMFMEPEAGLAWHEAALGTLHLVLGTQSPDGDASNIKSMFDAADSPVRLKEIRLTSCYPGGGFGGRDSSPFSLLLALAAAFSDGHPVKVAYDRFEQFRVGLKRPAAALQGALVCAPDMKLQLVRMTINLDGGGLKNLSPYVASLASFCAGGSYEFPMANVFAQSVHTRNIPGGSQRGFGGPEAFLAVETALDDLAAAQKWDPIAMRRANLATAASLTVVGGPIAQDLQLAEMLDRVEAHPLWAQRDQIKSSYAARGLVYGTGIAMSLQAYGTSGDGMVAAVLIGPDGRLTVQSDAVDMGNGSATTLGVVIGGSLGANADQVDMGCSTLFGQTGLKENEPTDYSPHWDQPFWTAKGVGSSSACLTGLHQVHTVQQTATALMAGAVLPAARIVWKRPDLQLADVEWVDGSLRERGGAARASSRAELAKAIYDSGLPRGALGHAYFQSKWVEGDFETLGGTRRLSLDGLAFYGHGQDKPNPVPRQNTVAPGADVWRYSRFVWAPCVNVVGLTVDKTTGRVQIENVLSVLNAGRVYVPELVSGQSQGGVAMAIGYTLFEAMPVGMAGPANGRWNLDKYHVPRAEDVPLSASYAPGRRAQELIVMPETPGDNAEGRGIAEAVMCSVAPAISNAIRDAVGRRFASLPITPAKVLQGLAQP